MFIYLFTLGHQPDISHAEILSVCESLGITVQDAVQKNKSLLLTTAEKIDVAVMIKRLGGTQRIATPIETPLGTVPEKIIWYLQGQEEGKIRFGLSGVSDVVGIKIKKEIKRSGRSVRYVSIKNMATIIHNNLVERKTHITIFDNQLFLTEAIYDFEDMSVRDYDRPSVDAKSGMLPPKLARIMLNLVEVQKDHVLLDPFCGSGTVLMEASLLPFGKIIGSDISEKAVADTEKNMQWVQDRYGVTVPVQVQESDVQKITAWLENNSVDAIVSEPFMGKPKYGNESLSFLNKEADVLKKLFDTMLGQFSQVLKDDGTIVFVKPRFLHKGKWVVIDWEALLAKHGFDVVPFFTGERFLLYARSEQHVGREIWRLQKKK